MFWRTECIIFMYLSLVLILKSCQISQHVHTCWHYFPFPTNLCHWGSQHAWELRPQEEWPDMFTMRQNREISRGLNQHYLFLWVKQAFPKALSDPFACCKYAFSKISVFVLSSTYCTYCISGNGHGVDYWSTMGYIQEWR